MLSIIMFMDRITITSILLLVAGSASAEVSLRCDGRFVKVGSTMSEVMSLCGDPAERVINQVPVRAGSVAGFSRFVGFAASEQWVYDRGWGRFPAVLTFFDGEVQRIDFLRRRSGAE